MTVRTELAIATMERFAELKGDITSEVLDLYYTRFPEAQKSFEIHGCGQTAELESRMVTTTAFYLLQWIENPPGMNIELGTSVPHH